MLGHTLLDAITLLVLPNESTASTVLGPTARQEIPECRATGSITVSRSKVASQRPAGARPSRAGCRLSPRIRGMHSARPQGPAIRRCLERALRRVGEARGEARGRASVLLEALTKLCGPLPEDLEQRVRQLSMERLKELGKTLFDFRSPLDLQGWLDAHEVS
jgi:hypothetical protein